MRFEDISCLALASKQGNWWKHANFILRATPGTQSCQFHVNSLSVGTQFMHIEPDAMPDETLLYAWLNPDTACIMNGQQSSGSKQFTTGNRLQCKMSDYKAHTNVIKLQMSSS